MLTAVLNVAMLDAELEKWRNQPLGCVKALVLDAFYEKVRMDGAVVSCAVLVASGVLADGRRTVLGVSASVSGAEIQCCGFLQDLTDRGVTGLAFFVAGAFSKISQEWRPERSASARRVCRHDPPSRIYRQIPCTAGQQTPA